ncbi:mediator of RNA polymerase II transcription subunit 26 [Biomphalaria glabrata]|nr:mediator of RNA polymerase II transcription subunit 26 [Biomphalaria glabrata]
MRERPMTGTLARPELCDLVQWSGERVPWDYSPERSLFQSGQDHQNLPPRPKTSIGAARGEAQFYSERYRRRNSSTRCGYYSTSATATYTSDDKASVEAHRFHPDSGRHVAAESTDLVVARGRRVSADVSDRVALSTLASSRPKTSTHRRHSEYTFNYNVETRSTEDSGGIASAQQTLTYQTSATSVKCRPHSRERRTSTGSAVKSGAPRRRSQNSVTFTVPNDPQTEVAASVPQPDKVRTLESRRMSAPELPPIVDNKGRASVVTTRADKRNSLSNTGNHRVPLVQQAPSIKSKPFTSRLISTDSGNNQETGKNISGIEKTVKKKKDLPRNFSEPLLSGLLGNASTLSQESISTSRSYSTNNADALSGSGSKQMKFFSNGNRALSWCATDTLGSQNKLETLFEGKVQNHGNDADGVFLSKSPPSNQVPLLQSKASSASSTNNIISIISTANNVSYDDNNNTSATNSNADPSAGHHRSRKDRGRLQSLNASETPRARMHRSNSENKLNGNFLTQDTNNAKHRKSQPHRNQSVDRVAHQATSPQRTQNKTNGQSKHVSYRLRRASSNVVLNTTNTNRDEDNNPIDDYDYQADDRELLNQARIEAWLNVVNNVDEYDTDPLDMDYNYTDETPQTDTAIHLVYEGD